MPEQIIVISGLPGAGKSIVSEVGSEMGHPIYSMGDVVRDEAERMGISPTPNNLGKITLDLRNKEGPSVVAKRMINRIRIDDSKILIVEGVRSNDELDEFKKYFKVTVIAIISPPEIRFTRLKARGRSDDPKDFVEFNERDKREQGFGISDVIGSADRYILNTDVIETFREEIRIILKEIAGVE